MNSQKTKAVKVIISVITFVIFVSTGFQDKFLGNWSYQEMPTLPNVTIADMKFLDSLTGFAVMSKNGYPIDTAYILKTTNGGYNWFSTKAEKGNFHRIQFLNSHTGYFCGQNLSGAVIYKTTNQGANWFNLFIPQLIIADDMYALNEDTIWFVESESLEGGVYRTTNGGTSWQLQWAGYPNFNNPSTIYMFNRNFGFHCFSSGSVLYRTTNSGFNWQSVSGSGFKDIYFFDTLNGYKSNGEFKKTTDGGLSWMTIQMPNIPSPGSSQVLGFSFVNKDTVWAGGGYKLIGNVFRGVVYNSTNSGTNWRYQIPDSSNNNFNFRFIQFLNAKTGWLYGADFQNEGFHTTLGGDTAFTITAINNNDISQLPEDYLLYQNYPNPFNHLG